MSDPVTPSNPSASATEGDAMVVVELRKKRKKKDIKRLRHGRGKLMDEVQAVMDGLRAEGTVGENAQPVVIVVERKSKRWSMGF